MPDDPKTALPGGDDGSGGKPSATPAPGTSDAGETPEQKLARVEKERDEALDRANREAELRKAHQGKVEEANRIIASGRSATDDPLEAEISLLEQTRGALAARGQDDPVTEILLRDKLAEREARRRDAEVQRRIAQAQSEIVAVPEPYRARTWALWQSGQFYTIAAAHQAARGEEADELRKKLDSREADEKKREADILARQAAAPGSPRGGGGGVAGTKPRMGLRQYVAEIQRLESTDPAAARKLTRDKDSGAIEIDYAT